MRVDDVMSKAVETVDGKANADNAWERMAQKNIHHLVVMDQGRVTGVLSERDLGGRNGVSVRKGKTASELMSAQAVTVKPTQTIRQAANLMRGRGIGCLPVVEDGKLKGIVTVTDLLELIGHGLERPTARAERAILSRRHGREHKPAPSKKTPRPVRPRR